MERTGNRPRHLATTLGVSEVAGFALLVPWTAAIAGADVPVDVQLALFVLPLLALVIGIALLYSVLTGAVERARPVAVLVLAASLCLIGSVVYDSISHGATPRVHVAKNSVE